MAESAPSTRLDPRYSSDGATATPWEEARRELETAKTYWLATVRPDGRPHVTTIAAIWLDGAVHFVTGEHERKAANLARNSRCLVTTGCNGFEGLDVVVEGTAERVTDDAALRRLAGAYLEKYDRHFRFEVRDGELYHEAGSDDREVVYRLHAVTALGFGKGASFSQTSWRF